MANALVRGGRSLLQQFKQWWGGEEGSWRGPFFGQGHLGHWFELGRLEDGFQRDLRLDRGGMDYVPVIAGLRQLHRSAFAQLRPHQYTMVSATGVITDVTNATPLRCMLRPNSYESGADFNARLVDEWMTVGEVVVLGVRNDRSEVAQMHILPRGHWQLMIDHETQTIFYGVSTHQSLAPGPRDVQFVVPARDILHLRWSTPRHPLMGESGFAAAGLAAGIHVALSRSQAAFFAQMRRPSGVLSTDQQLDKAQMTRLREAYDEQARGMAAGGVPILSNGLKWVPMGISSEDAEVIAALRMSNEEIARCVGVPGPLVGDLEKSALTNTEALIAHWLSISLGGLIERYERALENLFELNGRTDWIDMSTDALLRVDMAARMEALTKGVQGGVLKPNEARAREGLSPVDGGDNVFMQRQNTPVSLLAELAAADLKASEAPAPSPSPTPSPPPPENDTAAKALEAQEFADAMLEAPTWMPQMKVARGLR